MVGKETGVVGTKTGVVGTKTDADSNETDADSANTDAGSKDTDAVGTRTDKSSGATAPGDMGGTVNAPLLRAALNRTFLTATTAIATAAAIVFGTLWATDNSAEELDTLRTNLATDEAAEKAASTYALNVSQVDPTDIEGWRKQLQTEVTPDLAPKLSAAVDVVGPWLTQMEYTSTAEVLAADVSAREGDLYTVQVFVDMKSRSRQTPDGVTATAAYTVTLDRAANWTITDVGGVTPDLPGPAPR
ncbi:hypothetical protein [Nocardia sp. NPDC057353]|uniref:hypothetical protein n=1 Tax=Nocardia sp. NPDC057353 TaxID=3346104 RepID=UPI00362D1B22